MSEILETRGCTERGTEDAPAWFVYMLDCVDGSYYTGITTDVSRRVAEHLGRGGLGARYTRSHPACGIACVWHAADRADASRLEWRLKHLTRARKERLVAGEESCGHERAGSEQLASWWSSALDLAGR